MLAQNLAKQITKQILIKHQGAGIKNFNNFQAFVEYSNDISDIYKNIQEYNSNKKRKILSVFDDLIADMRINKNHNPEKLNYLSEQGQIYRIRAGSNIIKKRHSL